MTCITVNRHTFRVNRGKVSCSMTIIYNTVTNSGHTRFTLLTGKNQNTLRREIVYQTNFHDFRKFAKLNPRENFFFVFQN